MGTIKIFDNELCVWAEVDGEELEKEWAFYRDAYYELKNEYPTHEIERGSFK